MARVSRPELKIKKTIAGLEQDAKELLAIRDENYAKYKTVQDRLFLLQSLLVDDPDDTPEPELEPEQEASCTS